MSGHDQPLFVLDRLRALGPFFVLHTDGRGRGAGWRPVTDLLDDTAGSAQRLDELIDQVGDRLTGTGDPMPPAKRWVAASVLQLGWAARLTSVYAGSLTLGAPVPDLAAARLRYRPLGAGRVELAADDPAPLDAEAGWKRLTRDHLDPLADAIRGRVRIGRRLLDGNVASALAGSLATLARAGHAPLEALVDQPWARPPELASLGRWVSGTSGAGYVRTTCCGYEQLPHGSRCGDCSLDRLGRHDL